MVCHGMVHDCVEGSAIRLCGSLGALNGEINRYVGRFQVFLDWLYIFH